MGIPAARSKTVQYGLVGTFFLQGALSTTQIPRIPELIDQIGVGFSQWGAIIGFSAIGGLVGLLLASKLITKFSSRRVAQVTSLIWAGLMISLPWTSSPEVFFAIQVLMAFVGSCFNIALNAQAVVFQKIVNRTILGRFHAAWSIGATSSAALSGVLVAFVPLWLHLLVIPLVAAAFFIFATSRMLSPAEVGTANEIRSVKKIPFFRSPTQFWLLAFGLFAGVFPEVSMMDWSAVFGKKVLLLDAGLSSLPYTMFAGAMIISRLLVGRLTKKRSFSQVASRAGFLATAAMVGGLVFGPLASSQDKVFGLAVTVAFWTIAGLGIGPMVPSFMSAGGHLKGLTTAQTLARMSLVSSLVIMAAKVVMGAIAQNVNLVAAFVFPSVALLAAALLANQVAKRISKPTDVVVSAFPPTGPIAIIDVAD